MAVFSYQYIVAVSASAFLYQFCRCVFERRPAGASSSSACSPRSTEARPRLAELSNTPITPLLRKHRRRSKFQSCAAKFSEGQSSDV